MNIALDTRRGGGTKRDTANPEIALRLPSVTFTSRGYQVRPLGAPVWSRLNPFSVMPGYPPLKIRGQSCSVTMDPEMYAVTFAAAHSCIKIDRSKLLVKRCRRLGPPIYSAHMCVPDHIDASGVPSTDSILYNRLELVNPGEKVVQIADVLTER